MYLQVEDSRFPVSSSLLVIHSKVLGRMITEAKKNPSSKDNSPLIIYLQKENRKDVELLLEFLYCARTKIDTVGSALPNILMQVYMLEYLNLRVIMELVCCSFFSHYPVGTWQHAECGQFIGRCFSY